jgi:hypothetical protein
VLIRSGSVPLTSGKGTDEKVDIRVILTFKLNVNSVSMNQLVNFVVDIFPWDDLTIDFLSEAKYTAIRRASFRPRGTRCLL